MARFKVKHIFTIANRGQVLAGEILEGDVSAGDLIRVLANNTALIVKVKSVELVDHKGKTDIALVLGSLETDAQEVLKVTIGRAVSIIKTH